MMPELHIPRKWTLDEVRNFAIKAHGGQMYAADKPYVAHLDDVVGVLKEFGFEGDRWMLAAGYLHDVVEDTAAKLPEITEEFGFPVSILVHRVTDESGENRRARKLATYPKTVESERAVILKLADRIANVRACIAESRPDLLEMYRKEHTDLVGHLYRFEHDKAAPMWVELNSLIPRKLSPGA